MEVEFRVNGVLMDPIDVFFYVQKPDRSSRTLQYGVDSEVNTTGTGKYEAWVDADLAGRWRYRWYGRGGPAVGAGEGSFEVRHSVFA